jgi:TrkA domain protein
MAVQIERTELPGIGTRYDVMTTNGRRIGVVARRDGERELAIFEEDDPDACRSLVQLSREEATALSEVLGAALVVGQLSPNLDLTVDLQTEYFVLPAQSVFAGQTLGDTKARTKTGVSVVAISHDGSVLPAPAPDAALHAGDTLVAVGTRHGLDALGRLLAQSD